jgi:hypothetical protein
MLSEETHPKVQVCQVQVTLRVIHVQIEVTKLKLH